MDQRNLTLPPPDATTIMSSSSAMAMAMASVAATTAATRTTIATSATAAAATTTPATFFTYSIPGMDIAPGPFVFTYVSEFLSLITPEEMPLAVEPANPNPQMSNEQKVDIFMKKHGVKEDVARQYLTSNGWVLDQASFKYESDKDGRNNNPTKEDTTNVPDSQSLHSLISQHTHRNGTDKDDQEAYFAGGSESSGQQIISPKRVNIDNSTPALTTNDSDRSIRAWGTGVRLASAHPINPPPVQSDSDSETHTETEHTIVVLHLWSEGFSLDDGSLRPYAVPENERFLRAVLRGDYPNEMQEFGHRVEVSVQDHTNERFRHLSRKQFMGSGRLLGSPVPHLDLGTQPQATATVMTSEQRAESGLHFNEKQPMTVIQLRLADGSRLAARFNLTHIVRDLYRYVRLARPQYSSQNFVLITAFPRQQLNETDQRTLAQADLRNVVVIQHICEDLVEQTQTDTDAREIK